MAEYYYTDANRNPVGPVPFDELEAMHKQGKLANGALVAEVGATEWTAAAELFGRPATGEVRYSAPPVTPTGTIGNPQDAFEPLAGWAFGLGLASWLCISILGAIPGVILGHMALSKMKRMGNRNQSARTLAIIGLILSYIQVGLTVAGILVMAFAVLVPALHP